MIKKQYALLDHTAQSFLNPITFTNDGEAIRWFTTQVNTDNKENLIHLYPAQYSLYRLADYDDNLGMFQPRDVQTSGEPSQEPKLIITGINVEETKPTWTTKELIELLKTELKLENVVDLKKESN